MLTRIHGSRLIDPERSVDGTTAGISPPSDLWMRDGRLLDAPEQPVTPDLDIDATGCLSMAGGIDLHTHIGGGKVSLARMLLRDQMPPWRGAQPTDSSDPADCRFLPSASTTASRYLDMGYTTCLEPAVIPCNARAAHAEMADVRGIDTGGYCLLGNDDVLLQLIAEKSPQETINAYVAWMVMATRCIAVKVVNPGGIHAFKFNHRSLDVDTPHPCSGVTPGQIVRVLCRAVHEIGLAHPLHVHCSNLGVPGNIASTLATIEAADGYPIHLTHAQFHCYGKDGPYQFSSAASALVEAMGKHSNVTIDVGQVQFGQTVTISADSMHQHVNSAHAKPRKSVLVDVECEAGCGVVPFRYRRREFVHSLQWAIGLELFLMVDDPSRVFLTTDHPNGGPFTAYPHLLGLLADRTLRETALAEIHPEAAAASSLAGISREYSLSDIAMMTRNAPARILGLSDRGTLAPGCVADVVVYRQQASIEKMFAVPELVFKSGELIRRCGAAVEPTGSPQLDCTLAADAQAIGSRVASKQLTDFRKRYAQNGTFALDRLWISDAELEDVLGSRLRNTGMQGETSTVHGGAAS
ncbi:formylmethanofuran dehydrogenase subunit A [Allorhodopirellula solitaria]|uniref:Formyltransferase/hydrolase complex Fhc subunit A n=1 Tax=Allorhodopirellula solitaria TaxID=2527987 RepID=A0A5C5XNW8_9BACT|nr:formylmethanofuran dehydrogenase subunit A [Allorhodopirellula solitaria]TWT64584.1 Formyltransferase/hydrolase complex Fhc subunit A [Allorhodopirellula solitaria]